MILAIGVDHRGVLLKDFLKTNIVLTHTGEQITWIDVGCDNANYCDYPEYAVQVVNAMLSKKADKGILICGTGIGMAITANRFPGIYAALAWSTDVARLSHEHDNSNILVLPADYVSHDQASDMVQTWLSADFLGGKYQRRIDSIDAL